MVGPGGIGHHAVRGRHFTGDGLALRLRRGPQKTPDSLHRGLSRGHLPAGHCGPGDGAVGVWSGAAGEHRPGRLDGFLQRLPAGDRPGRPPRAGLRLGLRYRVCRLFAGAADGLSASVPGALRPSLHSHRGGFLFVRAAVVFLDAARPPGAPPGPPGRPGRLARDLAHLPRDSAGSRTARFPAGLLHLRGRGEHRHLLQRHLRRQDPGFSHDAPDPAVCGRADFRAAGGVGLGQAH